MKTILTTTLALLFCLAAAQNEKSPLFQSSDHVGGFGGLSFQMDADGHYQIGGEGAWIIGNFYFGGFGFGKDFGSQHSPTLDRKFEVTQSTGGILLGAFSNTQKPFSLYTETRIAFGDVLARRQNSPNNYEEYSDETFQISPYVGLTYRPSNYIQVRFFAGYQFGSEIDIAGIDQNLLDGAVYGIGIFFGAFNY